VRLKDVTVARTQLNSCGHMGPEGRQCCTCNNQVKSARLVTGTVAAKYLGVEPRTIKRFVQEGTLTPVRLDLTSRRKFDMLDLDSLIVRAKEESSREDKAYARQQDTRIRR
jgi:hypothetical protein